MASARGDLSVLAERMGLEGAELKAWLDEQEARARDERAAEREARKELLELEAIREKNLQLQLKVAEAQGNRGEARNADRGSGGNAFCNVNPHSLIPGFNENRDDLDAYLKRFENVATGQE